MAGILPPQKTKKEEMESIHNMRSSVHLQGRISIRILSITKFFEGDLSFIERNYFKIDGKILLEFHLMSEHA